MATVLVTGGAGFIGSHACKALARAGHTPIVYDNLVHGHRNAVKWGEFEHGDIRDGARLDAVLKTHRPAAVVHFAAYAYVGESVSNPINYYDNNVGGTATLLAAMRRNSINRIVFSSTCATYGNPSSLPIDEESPTNPINTYGYTKLVVERMLADCAIAYGLNWAALRYFNAAGADEDGELGERHDPETQAIPLALRAAYGTGPAFKVFGSDYVTPDGSAIRDYIHVNDLAQAHVYALDHLMNGGQSDTFNLGTGRGVSVFEMLSAVKAATGKEVPHILMPRRPGDPAELVARADKAKAAFGWQPRNRDIAKIVATAAPWFSR
jgi:UDP-arabinose 4-epimerase